MMRRRKKNESDGLVKHYEIGDDFVKIELSSGANLLYTYESAGKNNIEEMKRLALLGDGLNSYINTCVKNKHEIEEK